jgi:hypothetical protein
VSVEALDQILSRSTVRILSVPEDKPPESALALVPSVVRTIWRRFSRMLYPIERSAVAVRGAGGGDRSQSLEEPRRLDSFVVIKQELRV